jgi:hypothetical protein
VTNANVFQLCQPETFADPLTEILRNGARALLAQAVEAEVAVLLASHADKLTDDGRQRLVRHGHLPEREIMTGIGPVGRFGAHPLFVGDSAALRAPLEKPRSADPDPLPHRPVDRRF